MTNLGVQSKDDVELKGGLMKMTRWLSIIAELGLLVGILSVLLTIAVGAKQGHHLFLIRIVIALLGSYLLLRLAVLAIRWLRARLTVFTSITDDQFIRRISRTDFAQMTRISILAHTGKSIYRNAHGRIEDALASQPGNLKEIRLLTRAPWAEGVGRYDLINSTLRLLKNLRKHRRLDADIRFYEALPSIRGIICEFPGGKRRSFVSTYTWEERWQTKDRHPEDGGSSRAKKKSHALEHAIVVDDSKDHPEPAVSMLESWMEHYWGGDEIHTIAFDFDDTLVDTTAIQAQAFARALRQMDVERSDDTQYWVPSLREVINRDSDLNRLLIRTFIDQGKEATRVLSALLPDAPSDVVDYLNHRRESERWALMKDARPFRGVEDTVRRLRKESRYSLSIISGADAEKITEYLKSHDLDQHFSVILGKRDPVTEKPWGVPHRKVYLILKLAQLIGIPLTRLVYIGDTESDRDAASALSVDFIHAKLPSSTVSGQSRSQGRDEGSPYVICDYKAERLDEKLIEIGRKKMDRKYETL